MAGILAVGSSAWADERFALIIGANMGWAHDRPLRHAESNAERLRDVLVELGGFAPDRVFLLLDPDTQAVRDHLRRLDEYLRSADDDSLLFFYYAGHADSQNLHLRGAPLTHTELASFLRESSGRFRIGLIDSCRSGSVQAAKAGPRQASFEAQVLDELEKRGLAVLSSTGADELSQEQRALQGSLFTQHFISALRGAADSDDDGQVTLAEAYQHALLRTQADTSTSAAPQTPLSSSQVIFSQLSRAASLLLLPRSDGERYVVTDRREWRLFAEAYSHPERQVRLAVAPGEYRVKHVGEERWQMASLQLTPGARMEVARLDFERHPFVGLLKGRPDLNEAAELRSWRQAEALRLLAAGEARAALRLFDRLLKEVPDDRAALRGRGRALVRLAEAYSVVGDSSREQRALRAAIASDPSLSEDPDFQQWYQRTDTKEGQQRAAEAQNQIESQRQEQPRLGRLWGFSLSLFGPRGGLTASGLIMLRHGVAPYVGVDLNDFAFVTGARWAPLKTSWSPLLGGGLVLTQQTVTGESGEAHSSLDLSAHVDLGMQYVSPGGFSLELGLGLLYPVARSSSSGPRKLPMLSVQWLF